MKPLKRFPGYYFASTTWLKPGENERLRPFTWLKPGENEIATPKLGEN